MRVAQAVCQPKQRKCARLHAERSSKHTTRPVNAQINMDIRPANRAACDRLLDELNITTSDCHPTTVQSVCVRYITRRRELCWVGFWQSFLQQLEIVVDVQQLDRCPTLWRSTRRPEWCTCQLNWKSTPCLPQVDLHTS